MRFADALKYTLLCMAIYMALCLFNLVVLAPVIDMITENWTLQLLIQAVLNLLVAPVLTFFLGEKLPFSARDLKVADGLEGALRSEVELPQNVAESENRKRRR